MKYKVDVVRIRENTIQLNGWAIGKHPESPGGVCGGGRKPQAGEI